MISEVRLCEPDLILLVFIPRPPFFPLLCVSHSRSFLTASDAVVALHVFVVGIVCEVMTDDGGRRHRAD